MNVLVAAQQRSDREAHTKVLSGLGHFVSVACSAAEVAQIMQRGPRPEVVLLSDPCTDWMQPLRDSGPHIYVVGCLERLSRREVKSAWDAGVDDLMSINATAEEVCGRVDAVERIRRWVGSMGDTFALGQSTAVDRLACLRDLGTLLACEFGQMTGAEMTADAIPEMGEVTYAAEIPLTLVSDGLELTLGVGIRPAAVTGFSELVFGGEVGHDILADATREFANTAGGLVKRTAAGEGAAFALGLPDDNVVAVIPSDARMWRLYADRLEICAWLVARNDRPKRVSASMLREGMVISKPVKNGSGVMLVPAGSVLTERTVRRLLDLLGPSTLVEVAHAA